MLNLLSNLGNLPDDIPCFSHEIKELNFDRLEQLGTAMLPKAVKEAGKKILQESAAVFKEGARGPTSRSWLVKEVVQMKIRLAYLDGMTNSELDSALRCDEKAEKRLRFTERLAERSFRRMLAALELLSRLESSGPDIRVETVTDENGNLM